MSIGLGTFIDRFAVQVATARHLLKKGRTHVDATGGDAAAMLEWRLSADMLPLAFQLAVVADFARQWGARAAGVAVPERTNWQEAGVAGLDQALAEAEAFLAGLDRAQIAANSDVMLTLRITDTLEPTLPVHRWITSFAATNIGFHLDMTYALLRANGVPLGKLDMFPAGL